MRRQSDFEEIVIQINRVVRATAGGKKLRFRACVAIGDKNGRVGIGVAKATEVPQAIEKAITWAKKRLITIPIVNDTIPHPITEKYGAAVILLKPASPGTGVIAGGVIRNIAELAGIKNLVAKILKSENKINNLRAAFSAFGKLKKDNKRTVN